MAIYAVLGSGTLTRKTTTALLKDLLVEGDEVYLAATDLDDAGRFTADYTLANNIGTVIFAPEGWDSADYEGADVRTASAPAVDVVVKGLGVKEGTLLFAYDEKEPPGQEDLLERVLRSGTPVKDLTDLLQPLELDTSTEPDEAQQAPAPKMATPPPAPKEPIEVVKEAIEEAKEEIKATAPPLQEKPESATNRLGDAQAERDIAVQQVELLALGQALKTILDYLKK